jgi:protein-tyrosine-phosphatase
VLFRSTHNSARSQMAEGLLRSLAGERFEVASAGTDGSEEEHLAVFRSVRDRLKEHIEGKLAGTGH